MFFVLLIVSFVFDKIARMCANVNYFSYILKHAIPRIKIKYLQELLVSGSYWSILVICTYSGILKTTDSYSYDQTCIHCT